MNEFNLETVNSCGETWARMSKMQKGTQQAGNSPERWSADTFILVYIVYIFLMHLESIVVDRSPSQIH